MASSELIKDFNRTRHYVRDFYVYGIKHRKNYTMKSGRTYDNERRRIESWLGEYMQYQYTDEGKACYLSIDSRERCHNPLFRAWKSKSFTPQDITLHFYLLDLLTQSNVALSLNDIMQKLDEKLAAFPAHRVMDVATVRNKLVEYTKAGLLSCNQRGKTNEYQLNDTTDFDKSAFLHYFAEVAPCGVVGDFILDHSAPSPSPFVFKHHYITNTLDNEVVQALLMAMQAKKTVTLTQLQNGKKDTNKQTHVEPICLMNSVQNGRQHLMAYVPRLQRFVTMRIDRIHHVTLGEPSQRYEELRAIFETMRKHLWGVSTWGMSKKRLEQVTFVVEYTKEESFIHGRLVREKRCGYVEKIDDTHSRFSAEVYDVQEMIPWIRTFIGRITEIHFSDECLARIFKNDLDKMYNIYEVDDA